MKKLSIKNLIDFTDYSTKRKENFAIRINSGLIGEEELKKEDGSGGDYWNRSISAISNSFKMNDNVFIREKIKDISSDKQKTTNHRTLIQYDSNLHNLYNYVDFNFEDLRAAHFEIKNNMRKSGIIDILNFSLKVKVHQIFTFEKNEETMLGAILFVANKKGFTRKQLGLYAEAVYRFLTLNFASKYTISSENIIIVDVYTTLTITYKFIENKEIPFQLDTTLLEIRNLSKY